MGKKLVNAMADLKENVVLEEVKALKEKKVPPLEIIGALQEGMSIVGKKYETKEYFLSDLIMSGEVFKEASDLIKDELSQSDIPSHGVFVLGTVFGDVHDIGKNIVNTILACNGFKVVDIGVDAPAEKFIEAIKEHQPQIVGISCLLTTVFDNIKDVIQAIIDANLRDDVKILIGGSVVNESVCEYVKADAFCTSAQQGLELSRKYVEGK